jgi:hypothetical protein
VEHGLKWLWRPEVAGDALIYAAYVNKLD